MRNLVEFPLTAQEAIDKIIQFEEDIIMDQMNFGDSVGGMDSYILSMISLFIGANREAFEKFVKVG